MALGKYFKVDGRKSSSNNCSTVTLVAFMALCLVGVWFMASSSIVPLQNLYTTFGNNNDIITIGSEGKVMNKSSNENNGSSEDVKTIKANNSKKFGDNNDDRPKDAINGDTDVNSHEDMNSKENTQVPKTTLEGATEVKQEDNPTHSQDTSISENEKGKEKNGNDEFMAGNRDSKEVEKRSDSEGKKYGRQVENHESGNDIFPHGAQSQILNEPTAQNDSIKSKEAQIPVEHKPKIMYQWKLCNVSAGSDFIPCLDNLKAIKSLRTTNHYEHRERHCPLDPPTCLVPLPEGYQRPIQWPTSRKKIWYNNVPHSKLVEYKGHQNWVRATGKYLTFPGGGTQFKRGAVHYIDFIQEIMPDIDWGNRSRVILDVGCGVASFGGFLFDKDVLTMSFAPKDEHEAQVQFALERGIPALLAVMGTQRLPFPGRVFDIIHCARCRVPWHIEGGKLLLELDRLLRPGGFFIWSATPVYNYRKIPEDFNIWEAMKKLTMSMCWEVQSVRKEKVNRIGVAVYQKPTSNECFNRRLQNDPPLCNESDDPNVAWKIPLQACIYKIPMIASERGSKWPKKWPTRMEKAPYWLLKSEIGVYGKAAPEDFFVDRQHWKRVVTKSYMTGLGINWSFVRNVMDMRAVYGGFAAALKDMNVWVMNVVSVDSRDTLPIIYERGLFGIYHDWCESFSSYPRTYDLLHADHLFSKIKMKCNMMGLVAEVDRLLRPEGILIVRDKVETVYEVESIVTSMHWEVSSLTYSKDKEGLLCVRKTMWRPKDIETLEYAIDQPF